MRWLGAGGTPPGERAGCASPGRDGILVRVRVRVPGSRFQDYPDRLRVPVRVPGSVLGDWCKGRIRKNGFNRLEDFAPTGTGSEYPFLQA